MQPGRRTLYLAAGTAVVGLAAAACGGATLTSKPAAKVQPVQPVQTAPPPPPTTTTMAPPPPTTPPTTSPPTTSPPVTSPRMTFHAFTPPPPPPHMQPPPPSGIAQGGGGDRDPDNRGGPNDGDGGV